MAKYRAVIGAGFGDEGKGRLTSLLASSSFSTEKTKLVVRFNGGAQAGHTVKTNDGRTHVFSHIGSGSFSRADTYLAPEFICNPIFFNSEYHVLNLTNIRVYVDVECRITTYWDILINKLVEQHRGHARHGSCGLGINETIVRNENTEFKFSIFEQYTNKNEKYIKELCDRICKKWVPYRLNQLGININDYPNEKVLLENYNNVNRRYAADCMAMINKLIVVNMQSDLLFNMYDSVIFEGAQGLMLDQDIGIFPHVTRSNTGLTNILSLFSDSLDVYYVTRCYTTRHGAGPLDHSQDDPLYNERDQTNVYNESQGSIRYSPLNFDLLKYAINSDLFGKGNPITNLKPKNNHFYKNSIKINVHGAMTCLDQIGDNQIKYIKDGKVHIAENRHHLCELYSELIPNTILEIDSPITNI